MVYKYLIVQIHNILGHNFQGFIGEKQYFVGYPRLLFREAVRIWRDMIILCVPFVIYSYAVVFFNRMNLPSLEVGNPYKVLLLKSMEKLNAWINFHYPLFQDLRIRPMFLMAYDAVSATLSPSKCFLHSNH